MEETVRKDKFKKEYEEIGKDIINVILSYTPLSGFLDTAKFVHKWGVKKKGVKRIARHVEKHRKRIADKKRKR
jgi:hypothetical protein